MPTKVSSGMRKLPTALAAWACVGLAAAGPSAAQTWSLRNPITPDPLLHVVFSSANTAVAVGGTGGDGDITVSSDGGFTWAEDAFAVPDLLNAIDFSGATMVAVGDNETLVRSVDRGATWANRASSTGAGRDMFDVTYVTTSIVVAVGGAGANGEILRSVNQGDDWLVAPAVANDQLRAVASSGTNVVAVGDAAGGSATVEFSIDNGVTWNTATSVANEDLVDVVFISASTAIAVSASGGEILRSTDAGDNWTQVHDAPGGGGLNAVAFSGNTVVAVGDDNGGNFTIERSPDAGVIGSWGSATTPGAGAEVLNDVVFLTSSIALAAGDNGTILGSSNGGGTWTEQIGTVGGSPTADDMLALAFNGGNNVLASGSLLLSNDQLTISEPIPFQSKWLLVLLLAGYSVFAINRLRRRAAAIQA